MLQNVYYCEIQFGFLSFLNPVHKNVNDSLMYKKSLKFCVLGILSFTFDEMLLGYHGWNKNNI